MFPSLLEALGGPEKPARGVIDNSLRAEDTPEDAQLLFDESSCSKAYATWLGQ